MPQPGRPALADVESKLMRLGCWLARNFNPITAPKGWLPVPRSKVLYGLYGVTSALLFLNHIIKLTPVGV
jgi:hypothetical protein